MEFSVVVPAHNEEALLEGCLASIRRAARRVAGRVETIVAACRSSVVGDVRPIQRVGINADRRDQIIGADRRDGTVG